MKTSKPGISAHSDASKTSPTERLLYAADVRCEIYEIGRIDRGDTRTDPLETERLRGVVKPCVITDATTDPIDTPTLHRQSGVCAAHPFKRGDIPCCKSETEEVSMKDYDPMMSFDGDEAKRYDDHEPRGDEAETVAFLEKLAGGGPALELAIGTGRIALPLAARGIRVDGIDLSPAMVEQLRKKPGGAEIEVTIGDFADVSVSGEYRLIYVVFNTLFNVLTQEDQVRCFENVAAHLTDDGSFVVEAESPASFYQLPNDQYVETEGIEVDEVKLDVLRHDPATQMIEESHVSLSSAGVRLGLIVQRYAWPAELDLMARIAGLRLKERYDGWNGEPFTGKHNVVSVYGR